MSDTLFAPAPDGTRLPVIDITNPAFAVNLDPAEIAALGAKALREEERRGPVQRFLIRLVFKRMARQSRLVAALQAANDGFLAGLPTYVMKLGAANLVPPFATPMDKAVVSAPIVAAMRIRLFQLAHLLADALAPRLAATPGAPLLLLEIAGGPSSDGLNTLILLAKQGLLANRPVRIVIYDIDDFGPGFAASMLAALQTGPLAGLQISLDHVHGSWSDTAALSRLVGGLPGDAVLAATSEGGLFEYGSDGDIVGVLETLAQRFAIVAGSVTRADRLNLLMRRHMTTRVIPRGLETFGRLIAPTGYSIKTSRPALLSDLVLLGRPAA